jgi:sec-independent protein translocase protein TatB
MFGIDSPELLVIAIVALVVIGPKELPALLRSWGKWMAKIRGMASEFRGHVDEMVRQSELDDVKKQLEAVPGLDLQSLDPTKQIKSMIQEGVAEGEKALSDAKASIDSPPSGNPPVDNPPVDNPLAEPESAPQIAVEPLAEPTAMAAAEPAPAVAEAVPPVEPVAEPGVAASVEDKPAKAAVAG